MAMRGATRVGDADREATAVRLREHYAAGRLTHEEFSARLADTFAATSGDELTRVTADLPYDSVGGGGSRPAGPTTPAAGWGRPARRRGRARLMAALAVAVLAIGLIVLASHAPGWLVLAALLLFVLPVIMIVTLAVALLWAGRRAWRSGAWIEGLPLLVGMPWLGRLVWAARMIWTGRLLWRAGGRFRRRRHAGAARYVAASPAYAPAAAGQPRAGARSGTTR